MSVVLACRAMREAHTYSYLAEMLSDIHKSFGIANRVVRTTTDNASNFVKSFRMFATTSAPVDTLAVDDEVTDVQLARMPVVKTKTGMTLELKDAIDPEEAGGAQGVASGAGEEDDFVLLDDVLNYGEDREKHVEGNTFNLPPHSRCAAHTLNLVASVDLERGKTARDWPKEYSTATAKAKDIWQHHSRSDSFKQKVKALVGTKLKTPVVTRWNSTFDSVKCINKILKDVELK